MKVCELRELLKGLPDEREVRFISSEGEVYDFKLGKIEIIQEKEHLDDYRLNEETPLPFELFLLGEGW